MSKRRAKRAKRPRGADDGNRAGAPARADDARLPPGRRMCVAVGKFMGMAGIAAFIGAVVWMRLVGRHDAGGVRYDNWGGLILAGLALLVTGAVLMVLGRGGKR